jgi:hypothetical protein
VGGVMYSIEALNIIAILAMTTFPFLQIFKLSMEQYLDSKDHYAPAWAD